MMVFDSPGPRLAAHRPLVLFFIRRDCPCSVEFEPFFHRLGAIPGRRRIRRRDRRRADAAFAYAMANKVPYRVLADPDRAIIDRFEAKHGGYVALLRQRYVDALWPGCSAEMMSSLGRRIAVIGAKKERPIDCSGMPKVLTTGCPFAS